MPPFLELASKPIEPPIRAELFGIERLEQHAESLAEAQSVLAKRGKGRALLPRVQDNARVLRDGYREIARVIREERAITPAAEWLVDNFHIVDEQLREIRDDLPVGFYNELPKLADGPHQGYPRVYGIAWAFVAHTDSRFDPDALRRFVQAYQRVQPLTIGELWAIAITLRVVLVENLRRLTESIVRGRALRQAADALADDLLAHGGRRSSAAAWELRSLEDRPLVTAFAVQLVQRLRDSDPGEMPALLWLNERLAAQGITPDDIVRREHRRQAAMNVTVRNVIMSMGLMSALDWSEFFETVSLVDDVLCAVPGYAAMDFATRDSYRHAIEDLARGAGRSEQDVTRAVMAAAVANDPVADPADARRADPGHYLVGNGRRAFETALGFRAPLGLRLIRAYIAGATPGYLGTIAMITAALLTGPLLLGMADDAGVRTMLALALAAAFPASDLAIALLNRNVTSLVRPRALPRLELRGGVPPDLRTIVVVPSLLTRPDQVEALIERLEVHYLANADGAVHFALLSDWTDAPAERMPGDEDVLACAREGIARLNVRHGTVDDDGPRFLLFHRRRQWNAGERAWMGWERKRGKLHELNRLLRGATDTSFLPDGAEGEASLAPGAAPVVPPGTRYVVTLDEDTRLPRGAVKRLVGTMAHPLNHPRFDPDTRRVVEGYGVLQPRVTPPLPGLVGSFFQRQSSGPAGIDPYAAAVSDVYQDLFGEGSFTGKGIYDVDAFESAMAGRVPENAMLSHDLFEGIFARAGLVTDIELFESAPSHYGVAAARTHRWARGDWQLLPWILGRRVPVIGRWKMVDNLRRTLSAPATFLTLVLGWTLPGAVPAVWTAFVLAVIGVPPLLPVLAGLVPRGHGFSKRSHARASGRDLRMAAAQTALTIAMLAHQAWLMLDAIARSVTRVYVTHRDLLEWVTAAQAKTGLRLDLRGFYQRMAGGVAFALAAAAAVALVRPAALPVALPFVLLWTASPAVARFISLPSPAARTEPLSSADARALRLIARRTWRFFATFVGPGDNALPPDNFQEDPHPVVAHRTSPTNLGLYLLATVTAHDFGWIGLRDAIDRLEETLATMGRLERFRGHFLNWYDTSDGRSLDPRYVSSVDSGNLAGHLIALKHACLEKIDDPVDWQVALDGIADAVHLVRESARSAVTGRRPRTKAVRRLSEALDAVDAVAGAAPGTRAAWAGQLAELASHAVGVMMLARALVKVDAPPATAEVLVWAAALEATIASHRRDLAEGATAPASAPAAHSVSHRLAVVARSAETMVAEMDFTFLFDPVRQLFAIGYRVDDATLDPGRYDLLASEARLTSFVAIAKGDVPVGHWFRLGRALTPVEHDSALVSWSGSMFEYLMPELVMHAPSGSLLEQSGRLIVRRQITYGAERGVPWGVSESAYSARDLEQTYQYSNFGVPGLGLRRGLAEDVVIAPYATGLAAMIDPAAAVQNFRRLADAGASGAYGFYEALDYTGTRLPEGTRVTAVRAYMAHHQGMLLVAIANVLRGGAMRRRFHAEPVVQATELLLQERTPRDVAVARPRAEEVAAVADVREYVPPVVRRFTTPHGPIRTHILSNGRYAVMLTAAGAGYSRWRDIALTRWREDPTRDEYGTHIFVRDAGSGRRWSVGHQPSGAEPDSYDVVFSEDRARYARRDGAIATTLDVIVSPEDDAEIRRVTLTNFGPRARDIELTSYAEVVLASPAADAAHPAFSNLFVHTECVPEFEAVLATRRPRAPGEPRVWLAHVAAVDGTRLGALQWETDRARFLGRGRGIRQPAAMDGDEPLSGSVGAVLDPIVSLRLRVRLRPGVAVRVAFSTLVAPTREKALDLAEKYRDPATFDRAATLAWTQAQVQMHHVGIGPDDAHLFQSLARRILYSGRTLRPAADVLSRHEGGPAALWAHGISGDLPIVLAVLDEAEHIGLVRQLLRAHEYWRLKQLAVDLVILNDRASSYVQDLQHQIETLVRTSQSSGPSEGHRAQGSVFILRSDLLPAAQRDVLLAAARAVLTGGRGTLSEQIARSPGAELALPAPVPATRRAKADPSADAAWTRPALEFFNGLGGFAAGGREYVTVLEAGRQTPAPWINVIANPVFGFLASEAGSGHAWSLNSRENKLTPWANDPVSDPPGEAIYIRDEETLDVWCPTALPIRTAGQRYVARHGQGYSRFEHVYRGIALELAVFVPREDPIKISRLTITNASGRPRRLSVTGYVEWVLGVTRSATAPFIVTGIDGATGAVLARNAWNTEFAGRVAFADLGGAQTSWTGDRTEFLGRNGTLDAPAGLVRGGPLSGRVGAGLDPCTALQATIELSAGAQTVITFVLGEAASEGEATGLIERYRAADLEAALRDVADDWDHILGGLQVRTPDRAMDVLLNRWLLYQTLTCRVWARSALYQAGGAYGFRDQIQDGMALCVAAPQIARAHLLRAASRQFVEGDVQHWWHVPGGRGVRTRIADDCVWLPYAAAHYLDATGDGALLDEAVSFLSGPLLAPGQHESYFQPGESDERATFFEHCARALDRSLAVGAHGLPLIGTGDWNDGMNAVGAEGRGESVWLGWFLVSTLFRFAPVAEGRGDTRRAEAWRAHAAALTTALEVHGWDGGWYRRAFFDDGTPLGSAENAECRIDSIAQSWAVISGAAEPQRARQAMAALEEQLIRRDVGLMLLFTPPFMDGEAGATAGEATDAVRAASTAASTADAPDAMTEATAIASKTVDPGYIKAYPAGIRENGGQYTHAALWSVIAFAELGEGDKAHELFTMLSPIRLASDPEAVERYKVEPYAVAADVYAEPAHVGRGGWTWYTGSAAWMYRAGVEWLLGFRVRGSHVEIDPCIPREWPGFEITLRYGASRYAVTVENPRGVQRGVVRIEVDGVALAAGTGTARVELTDDGGRHEVRVVMG